MKKAYLITWNENKWEWENYNEKVNDIAEGKDVVYFWNCSSKQPQIGDEVYLLNYQSGIVGHGSVIKEAYLGPDFNEEKAKQGYMKNHIDVKFDWLMDKQEQNYIPVELLTFIFPEQEWKPQASGISIKDEYVEALGELLHKIKKLPSTKVDFTEMNTFLSQYSGTDYNAPEKAKSSQEKQEMLTKRNSGQTSVDEFKKYSRIIMSLLPGYEMGSVKRWQNSGYLTDYFWIEFKKKGYQSLPHSISLSINKYPEHDKTGEVVLSVRVETKDTDCKNDPDFSENEVFNLQNSIVNLPKASHMFYQVNDYMRNYSKYDDLNFLSAANKDEIKKIKIVKNIAGPYTKENSTPIIIHSLIALIQLIPYYEHILKEREIKLENRKNNFVIEEEMDSMIESNETTISKNTILYGPPGTGKTYHTAYYSVSICDGVAMEELQDWSYSAVLHRFNELKEEGRIAFVTFHQSHGYEEFIEGIRPVMSNHEKSHSLDYEITAGVFKQFCEHSLETSEPSVFIIDEINRGNISKIFGELITLIEVTKRKGEKEELLATLPYSKEEFGVPSNVYILGTMNTADRSISLMDTALRRRFEFVEMMPNPSVVSDIVVEQNGQKVNIAEILSLINRRIEFLFDREHTIGHAFFTPLREEGMNTIENLAAIFRNSIIPLLQEYFYEDYEKIRLVLGDDGKENPSIQFITKVKLQPQELFSSTFGLEETMSYAINEEAFTNIESYRGIFPSN